MSALCRCWPVVLAIACGPPHIKDPKVANAGPGSAGDGEQTHAVLATVSEDYATGALATISLDDWSIVDTIVDVSGDPAVVAAGDYVFQLNRYGHDTVRVYSPGSWEVPVSEAALPDLSNPQSAEMCSEKVFYTLYGEDFLAVADPATGTARGNVDLSATTDADGIPEAATLLRVSDGVLLVGLRFLDRHTDWLPDGGALVSVDCESQAVREVWNVESPDVYPNPDAPNEPWVHEYGVGLRAFADGPGDVVVTTEALGGRIEGFAADGGRALATVADADYNYRLVCIDLDDGTVETLEAANTFLFALTGNDRGEAFLAARTHWDHPGAPTGTRVFSIADCVERTEAPLETLLAPYSITFAAAP